ncbi:uncharacterized protein LOC100199445 isoform X2 [Hydra vulgaris]|uniref:Uncharacterized protein LOC100199445 isoform X2 n=1 Tax=Hydra vulgaris TaxID=6087 RepID=A0ABM4B888_HYDVU
MKKEIVFYYDIICPYAYLASKLIENIAKRTDATLVWKPVLLGAIYKSTKPDNIDIPENKLIKTYSSQKLKVMRRDLAMQFSRHSVPISTNQVPDVKTLNALRLIAFTPDESMDLRSRLSHKLFDAIWQHKKDVSDMNILQNIADSFNLPIKVTDFNDKTHPARQKLLDNTDEAISRGVFGVPSMWVNNRLFFGGDRLFLVEREFGLKSEPHRVLHKPVCDVTKKAKLTFYLDFGSPWTFLGFKQLNSLISSVAPVQVDIEYVPVLIGVIFNSIGTPMLPMLVSESKRNYFPKDFNDWLNYHEIKGFRFSSHFPLKTLTACRLAIAHNKPDLINAIFDAVWLNDKDISNDEVLREILSSNGFNSDQLMREANTEEVKLQLKKNTQRALDEGVCGLPTYQVNGGPVVFGQDRSNVVADMLLGWNHNEFFSKL